MGVVAKLTHTRFTPQTIYNDDKYKLAQIKRRVVSLYKDIL